MLSKSFWTIAFFAVLASAKVVSWTAYSEESQAAADEAAIAGVAKQISAQIDASTSLYRSEKEVGDRSEQEKFIQTKSTVRSDIFLKGLKIQKLPKDGKRFGTTASVDLDELTSSYRFKLAEIQKEVSALEVRAEKALSRNQFEEAARLLGQIPAAMRPYKAVLEEMSIYVPIDQSLSVKTRVNEIRDSLINTLRGLTFKTDPDPSMLQKLKKDDVLNIKVTVVVQGSAVSGFPFMIEHGGKTLDEATTDSHGEASFHIPANKISGPPFEITVSPRLPLDMKKSAGLNSVKFNLQIEQPTCALKLDCYEDKGVCAAILKKISSTFGNTIESSRATPTSVRIQASPTRTMNQLTSFSVNLSLSKDGNKCQQEKNGTGRNREEAVANAIKKMDLGKCLTTLKICQ